MLFQSDQGSKYYKEIPLSEVLVIDSARLQVGDVMHCFELRTTNIDYYVGQDPLYGLQEGNSVALPPPDSGIGAYLAKSWETSIRQALLPVTTNTSKSRKKYKMISFIYCYQQKQTTKWNPKMTSLI